ncbi:MAG: ABC transporter ATP-binding protein [Candidatus Paceibacterota bacterium]
MSEILKIDKLTKYFDGIHAVDHLSISIEEGKITSIVGPNGSGKTTLINLISGVKSIDSGHIIIKGISLSKIKTHEVSSFGITRTFQNIKLFEQMTILDNILVVITKRNLWSALFEKHKDYHLKQAEEVLRRVNLWEKKNELAVNLSYGQRKLLEIARAISMDVNIFLFDEPFAGLFPEMRKTIVSIIKELKEHGKTIILIEHNMDLIRELSDRLIVMDEGKLLAEGNPEKVLSQKNVIEAYLGE